LIVNANTVLAFAVSPKRFQSITRQRRQILEDHGSFQAIQFHPQRPFNAGERFDPFAFSEIPGPLVAVT
jgi:hypothetical protein